MPRVQAGEVQLGWREWGRGDITVVSTTATNRPFLDNTANR